MTDISMHPEHDITQDIDASRARFEVLRANLRSKPMKYALESVPELIGENEFHTLVSALGLSQSFTELLDPHQEAVGAWFARTVSRMAKANEVRRRRGDDRAYVSLSDLLEASR